MARKAAKGKKKTIQSRIIRIVLLFGTICLFLVLIWNFLFGGIGVLLAFASATPSNTNEQVGIALVLATLPFLIAWIVETFVRKQQKNAILLGIFACVLSLVAYSYMFVHAPDHYSGTSQYPRMLIWGKGDFNQPLALAAIGLVLLSFKMVLMKLTGEWRNVKVKERRKRKGGQVFMKLPKSFKPAVTLSSSTA